MVDNTNEDRRRNLRDMLDELDRYFEELERDIQEAVRGALAEGGILARPFVAGFSMKVGPEGRPSIEFFGDDPQANDGYRSPIHEQILDEKQGTLKLVFDIPGVEKEGIQISATESSVLVTAEGGNRKYKSEVRLRSEVDPDTGKAEYRNGVLEISFSLRDKANKGYRRVSVV
jgi:HSP20 family protein